MYCKNCGGWISDDSVFCSYCGCRVDEGNRAPGGSASADNESNVWFSVLSFFVPLAGLILYIVYETKNPTRAKAAGKWAIIGFLVSIGLSIIASIFSMVFFVSGFDTVVNMIVNTIGGLS